MTEFVLAPKKALAVIVMIAFIMVCVLSPFGAAHAIVGLSTAGVTILVAALAAIGITFTTTGVFDNIEDYVESLLQEYAEDNNIPVTSIFNGSQWGANAAGKLILNNRFVQLISSFATWVKVKFSLQNNSTHTISNPGATLDGMVMYSLPITIYDVGASNGRRVEYTIASTGSEQYALFQDSGGNSFSIYVVSTTPGSTIRVLRTDNSPGTPVTLELVLRNNGSYAAHDIGFNKTAYVNDYTMYSNASIEAALNNDGVIDINNIGIGINTGNIDIPTDRTGYSDADGAVLDVSAPWSEPVSGVINTVPSSWDMVEDDTLVYSLDLEAEAVLEEQLPNPTDIENLPGATIPGIPDIDGEPWHLEFSNLWHYVAQWISDMSAGGAVIWNTCIQAPPPVVNLVFAGIVLAMWFGAIKILR